MVCSKYLPAGLHGCEGSALFVNALGAFWCAVARAVWSKKLITNSPALLSLLDGPWGSDAAFFVIWSRFGQLRRYLAYQPGEVDRMYRLLDYVCMGSPEHGPIHLFIDSALEIRFSCESEQLGWNRPGLPPLRMAFSALPQCHIG